MLPAPDGFYMRKTLLTYLENLDKLFEQQADYFMERVENAKQNNWQKVTEIEEKYLKPLEIKITSITKIIKEELK